MNEEINKLIEEIFSMTKWPLPQTSLFELMFSKAIGWILIPRKDIPTKFVLNLPVLTIFPDEFAISVCAEHFLKQMQHKRPILQTSHDGDWFMEIDHKVDHPAIHWDRQPRESIIRSVHAYLSSKKKETKHAA